MPRGTRLIAAIILAASPLLLGAADPTGDVAPCPDAHGGTGGDAPDLVSAKGQIVELGTSALWTLRFADDVQVPDDDGKPFRVDLLLHDPVAPVVNFSYYRDVNRLIRYDAVEDPRLTILLLPERGQNVFLPPKVEGRTMVFQVPGRILSADEDETGTSPGIERVHWSVIVRDEDSCDLLGVGRPRAPMVTVDATPSPAPDVAATPTASAHEGGITPWIVVGSLALVLVFAGIWFGGRRRTER